jgi:hypothetical protein
VRPVHADNLSCVTSHHSRYTTSHHIGHYVTYVTVVTSHPLFYITAYPLYYITPHHIISHHSRYTNPITYLGTIGAELFSDLHIAPLVAMQEVKGEVAAFDSFTRRICSLIKFIRKQLDTTQHDTIRHQIIQ